MPKFKRNHYIPKVLLKNWIVNNEGRLGVHVFETAKYKSHFSTSNGRKPFSFAISNDLYIPKVNDIRYVGLEKYFSNLEDTFGRATKILLSNDNVPLFTSSNEISIFLRALLAFRHRTKHVIESNQIFLENNLNERNLILRGRAVDQKILLIENIVNAINHEAAEYNHIEFVISKPDSGCYILGDMPILTKVVDNFSFIPIAKRSLLAFRPSEVGSTYKRINGGIDLVNSINEAIAASAKKWIIAESTEQLAMYKDLVNTNPNTGSIFVHSQRPIIPFTIE